MTQTTLAFLRNLGTPVTTRTYNWLEMAQRSWGSEFKAPDHDVYKFSNGRGFDSTDMGFNGIYGPFVPVGNGGLPDLVLGTDDGKALGTDSGDYVGV